MRKFVFELDSVLRLRRQQLQLEETKLYALLAERRRLAQVRAALETEAAEAAAYIHAFQFPSAGELRALASHKLGLQARDRTLDASVAANEHAIGAQTDTVIRAKRNEKLLAKLRNRRLADWSRELDRATEAEIQEAWTALWNRS